MKIVLANSDYTPGPGCGHMTDEGHQLQDGLRLAGWTLVGPGFDGMRDVRRILDRYRPEAVFVQDVRDWDPASRTSFRKDVGFTHCGALGGCGAFVSTVVKDAGTSIDYQREFYGRIGAHAAVVYYHPMSVRLAAPWLQGKRLIRTYHSIDIRSLPVASVCSGLKRGCVTGAVSNSYPLRHKVFRHARYLGIDDWPHPGYGNRGRRTPAYLGMISMYKTHVCTASKFGFALRKVIESVAVGCTPITDLPAFDRLPWIDGALQRIPPQCPMSLLETVIGHCEAQWDPEDRLPWARRAWSSYDYRSMGRRLDRKLSAARHAVLQAAREHGKEANH